MKNGQLKPGYTVADVGYGSESNYQHILDDCDRIPLITYGTYYRELKKNKKESFLSEQLALRRRRGSIYLSKSTPRQVHLNPMWEYFKSYTKEKISDEKTTAIYKKRKVDVEPVFGFLKTHLGFTRFHVRGYEQVTNEIGLALMAVNLRKLAVRWREKSTLKNNMEKFCDSEFFHVVF